MNRDSSALSPDKRRYRLACLALLSLHCPFGLSLSHISVRVHVQCLDLALSGARYLVAKEEVLVLPAAPPFQ